MATPPPSGARDARMNSASLYREEIYTDRAAATLRVLVPVTKDGAPDASRPTLYMGEAQILTNVGPLPISFEIEAKNLSEAVAGYAEAAKADTDKTASAKSDVARTDAARIDIAKVEVAKTSDSTPATPLVAPQSYMAPPDPAAAKLTDPAKPLSAVTASPIPEVVASAPVSDADADRETAPKVAIQRTQFGVDLGTASSVPGLRALWRGLLKSRSNAQLSALRPIVVIKEGAKGLGMQLRLVAGPLNDAGAAAKICAVLAENGRSCETAIFDGQRLSVTGDDPAPPPASKPSQRRLGANKRAAAVFEEPPRKPEPSSTAALSSWLGKKGQ